MGRKPSGKTPEQRKEERRVKDKLARQAAKSGVKVARKAANNGKIITTVTGKTLRSNLIDLINSFTDNEAGAKSLKVFRERVLTACDSVLADNSLVPENTVCSDGINISRFEFLHAAKIIFDSL